MQKRNLVGLDLNDLNYIIRNLNQPNYRAKQLFQWIYKGIYNIDEMQNIPKTLGKIKIILKFIDLEL